MAYMFRCAGNRSERVRLGVPVWLPLPMRLRVRLRSRLRLRHAVAVASWSVLAATGGWSPAAIAADAPVSACASPLRLAAESLADTYRQAAPGEARARAAAAWGHALQRLDRPTQADALLREAVAGLQAPRERAAAWLDLGNLALARQLPEQAADAWSQALQAAPGQSDLELAVALNRLRLSARPSASTPPLAPLQALAQRVAAQPAGPDRTRLWLHLATQARALGADGQTLAFSALEQARAEAEAAGEHALAAEAFDGLSALAEAQGRDADALRGVERGLRHGQQVAHRELLVPLEWRAARLSLKARRPDRALAAYRRAVEHVEAVRIDIPVRYLDGRSSFRDTLEPVYLGLTDQLLQQAASESGAARDTLLRQARDTVELIKQTELEDYLRDRCAVGSSRRERGWSVPPATAVYYPVILPDRLELLVETAQGIDRWPVAVDGATLRRTARRFVAALRDRASYRSDAEQLYRWLLAPLEPMLERQGIRTLVVVPDGVLRLVPLAALHDGHDFVVRRLNVATAPALSLAAAPRRQGTPLRALLAGLSEPGPVVDKLSTAVVDVVLDTPQAVIDARSQSAAAPSDPAASAPASRNAVDDEVQRERAQARSKALRQALSLPGVQRELTEIAEVLPGKALLNQAFTLSALRAALQAADYPIVHIASHGVFGDSADSTFIMTYDELLTLDGLQGLLGAEQFRQRPIELITLSACQTAEGDDRAPLGMSGTAIKAHARSALGTLWPVSDTAAQALMGRFYQGLATGDLSKIEALRRAQLELIGQPKFQHPFYWAPFSLIGDWQ
jgi:CHAT domain-containing protein